MNSERPTKPGTPESIRALPSVCGYEAWRPSEGRFAKVIADVQAETDNDPRIMARALDQYLAEREQDWIDQCNAAKERKWFDAVPKDASGFLMEPVATARQNVEIAELREQELALQLAAALVRIRELEAKLAGALVPQEKPQRIEPGQRWANVGSILRVERTRYRGRNDVAFMEQLSASQPLLLGSDDWVYLGEASDAK